MAKSKSGSKTQSIIEILPEELDDFEREVKRFQAGEWDPKEFMAFRLRQGVYGQRQADVQMFRIKAPFGGLTSDQMDALGDVAEKFTPLRKGHLTTRENVQFHHIKLTDMPEAMRIIGDVRLSSREACGNTVRNVTGCSLAGVCSDEPFDVTPYAAAYSRYFVRHPFTQALPRKFKTAFSGCERDCAITSIHDMGFIPKIVDGKRGFKVVTGGGTSIMARIAPTLYDFVTVDEYLKVTEAVIRIFHSSNELRKNRMKARIKFLIDRIGIDDFRDKVDQELKEPWAQRSFDPTALLFVEDEEKDAPVILDNYHMNGSHTEFTRWVKTNVHSQKQQGYKAVTIKLPLGDISAEQFHDLANIARKYAGGRARITHQQNLTFRWVPEGALYELWETLKQIDLNDSGANEITDVIACPGTDSCKLGITSSMGLGRSVSRTLQDMNVKDPLTKKIHVKMSGCPNGCAQHHIADIGLHGAAMKGPGGQVPAYEMFLGGSYDDGNTTIAQRVKTKVPAKKIPDALNRVIALYQKERHEGEIFREFVLRVGAGRFEDLLADFKDVPDLNKETLGEYMDWDKTVKYMVERGEGECAV